MAYRVEDVVPLFSARGLSLNNRHGFVMRENKRVVFYQMFDTQAEAELAHAAMKAIVVQADHGLLRD